MAETDSIIQVISEDKYQFMHEQFHRFYLTLSGLEKVELDEGVINKLDLRAVMLAFDSLYEGVTDMFKKGANNE